MKKDLQMECSTNCLFVLKVVAMITAAAGTSCLAENPVVHFTADATGPSPARKNGVCFKRKTVE
jgi:hypothetical protein